MPIESVLRPPKAPGQLRHVSAEYSAGFAMQCLSRDLGRARVSEMLGAARRTIMNLPRSARLSVLPVPGSVAFARHWTVTVLREWDLEVDFDTAELLVSELVTNALIHGVAAVQGAVITVILGETEGALMVEVHDLDQGTEGMSWTGPMRGEPQRLDESGRGLELVENLAREWGVEHEATGKYVYFVLSPPNAHGVERQSARVSAARRVQSGVGVGDLAPSLRATTRLSAVRYRRSHQDCVFTGLLLHLQFRHDPFGTKTSMRQCGAGSNPRKFVHIFAGAHHVFS